MQTQHAKRALSKWQCTIKSLCNYNCNSDIVRYAHQTQLLSYSTQVLRYVPDSLPVPPTVTSRNRLAKIIHNCFSRSWWLDATAHSGNTQVHLLSAHSKGPLSLTSAQIVWAFSHVRWTSLYYHWSLCSKKGSPTAAENRKYWPDFAKS